MTTNNSIRVNPRFEALLPTFVFIAFSFEQLKLDFCLSREYFSEILTRHSALLHYKSSLPLASMLDAEHFIAKVCFVNGKGSGSVYTREYQLFLKQLVTARTQSGLSQRALAEKLGKSYSYVAKCETGYVRMDIYQIRQYLNAVGVSFLEFMTAYENDCRPL